MTLNGEFLEWEKTCLFLLSFVARTQLKHWFKMKSRKVICTCICQFHTKLKLDKGKIDCNALDSNGKSFGPTGEIIAFYPFKSCFMRIHFLADGFWINSRQIYLQTEATHEIIRNREEN